MLRINNNTNCALTVQLISRRTTGLGCFNQTLMSVYESWLPLAEMLETEVATSTALWKPRPLAFIEFCDNVVKMKHRLIKMVISCILLQLV